ncbi:hypothetical protein [Sphaerisporangium corydalis]|uniref:DUF2029 domain-containing protein n=1 Tax=Sphaerisporangium corydalis TaxID=1441875 RepID=A0ABV9EE09_9ACTN|nr:hypothetical protein [Sphaerisporangium corydalis]
MERAHLESAAATYSYLRGLLSIPVGVLFILAGLSNLEWGPLRQVWVFGAAVLAAGVAYLLITRYYTHHYGRVTPSTRAQVKAVIATIVCALVVTGGLQADWSLDLPVNGTAIAFALVMAANYAIPVGLRAHHMVICGALLVAGLLPLWGDVGPDYKINVGLMLMGVATIAAGIFDHGALKRTFGAPKDLNPGNSNAGI